MSTTTAAICAAVLRQTGDRVALEKTDGVYYWQRPLDLASSEAHPVDRFEESCLHVCRLDRSPAWFVKDYVSRLQ